jgi:hypothetical protein
MVVSVVANGGAPVAPKGAGTGAIDPWPDDMSPGWTWSAGVATGEGMRCGTV